MHYYQFNIDDYRGATAHLSNEEDLAYRRLLDMYYDTEQKIPLDLAWVAKRLRVNTSTLNDVLNDMFERHEDGYFHARCNEVIKQFKDFAEAGKRGAAKRWAKETDSPPIAPLWGGVSPPNAPLIATNNYELETKNNKLQTKRSKVNTPQGVTTETWDSFVAQRKLSKATITQTVINSIQREADKAGWTLEQALAETVTRGWRSFKAEWVKDKVQAAPLKSFRQMDEERSKERYNQMVGRSSSRVIDITPDNFLEITDAAPKSH